MGADVVRKNECSTCGVAFDVGAKKCREQDCSESLPQVKPSRSKRQTIDPSLNRFRGIRVRARILGVEFSLTLDDIRILLAKNCIYCGSSDRIEVDRKDGALGYIFDNITPACHRCNTFKSNILSYEQMLYVAKYLGWDR